MPLELTDVQTAIFTIEVVTPEMARELIARKRADARPNEPAVKAYADAMRQERWILNGMPLIFSKSGVLLDGLCRLKAGIVSDTAFVTTIAQNIRDDVLHTLDQQRRRQYAGVLESRGERNAKIIQKTLAKLIRYGDGMMLKPNYQVPWTRLDRVLAANPGIRDAVKIALEHPATLLHPTIRCPLAYMGLQVDSASLRRFLDAVAYPDRFGPTEPGTVIRNMLESERGRPKRASSAELFAICIKALGATITPPLTPSAFYRWISKGSSRLGEDFPSLDGYSGLREPSAAKTRHLGKQAPVLEGEPNSAKIVIDHETITPDIAERYLRGNVMNRTIVHQHVDSIARDIRAGQWLLNAQPICFSSTGRLLNGQHRLTACIQAKQAIEVFIVRGLQEEAYDTYDLQAKKQPPIVDLIGNTGDKNAIHAAVRMVWKEGRQPGGAKDKPTAGEVRSALEANTGLLAWRQYARRNQSLGRMSTLIYVAHKLSAESPSLAPYFLDKLETGADLKAGDPILDLRNRLLRLRASRRPAEQSNVVSIMTSYWETFLRERGARISSDTPEH
jgi:hypothetical protein